MLNRHGKYNTVIRLYDKHELAYSSTKDVYTERMNSQYEFAKDNLGSLGINLAGGEGSDGTRVTAQNLNKILISKFMPSDKAIFRRYLRLDLHSFVDGYLCSSGNDVAQKFRL